MRTFTQRALLVGAVIGFGLLPARAAFAETDPVGPGDIVACDAFEPDTCPDDDNGDGDNGDGGLVCFDGENWQLCPDGDDGSDDGGTDDGGTDDGSDSHDDQSDHSVTDDGDRPVVVNPTFTG